MRLTKHKYYCFFSLNKSLWFAFPRSFTKKFNTVKKSYKSGKSHLRKLCEADFDYIYKWENQSELWAVSDEIGPYSREQIQAFMERCLINYPVEIERWIILNDVNAPIGIIDLLNINEFNKTASIGIFIASKTERKKGYASHALRQLIELMKLRKWQFLKALIHNDNIASIRLFTSIGFSAGSEQLHRGKKAKNYVYCIPIHTT